MILPVAAPATAATAVAIAATEVIGGIWGPVLATAAGMAALGVIAKFLHIPEVWGRFRAFLHDWGGEPARPGYEGRPSMPERMAQNHNALTVLTEQVEAVNKRVTDHGERNKQTIAALQEAVDALGRDQLLLDTARAIITELGHDGELPPKGGG